jgi:hypothetical protein
MAGFHVVDTVRASEFQSCQVTTDTNKEGKCDGNVDNEGGERHVTDWILDF